MFSRQSRKFENKLKATQASIKSIGQDVLALNKEVKGYTSDLTKEIEKSDGRKEQRLIAELDRCDDLLDKVDDLMAGLDLDQPIEVKELDF